MLRPWLVLVLMARRRRMMREWGAMLVTLWISHDVLSAPHHPWHWHHHTMSLLTQGSDQESRAAQAPALYSQAQAHHQDSVTVKCISNQHQEAVMKEKYHFSNSNRGKTCDSGLSWQYIHLLDLASASDLELDLDNKSVTTRPEPGVTFLRRSVYRVWQWDHSVNRGPPPPPSSHRDWWNSTESRETIIQEQEQWLPGGRVLTLTLFTTESSYGNTWAFIQINQ